jgi:acyl-coenzyme A synthetase/AMP-(fatty) acid ligase
MTMRPPPEMAEEAAREKAGRAESQWFTLPGLIYDMTSEGGDPEDYVKVINDMKLTVNIMSADIFNFYGSSTFTFITTNRLKPITFIVSMGEPDFRKEFFA